MDLGNLGSDAPQRVRRRRLGILSTGLALLAAAVLAGPAGAALQAEEFDVQPTKASLATSQAGAHSDFESRFLFASDPTRRESCFFPEMYLGCNPVSFANFRDVKVELPPGLIGNQSAFPTCSTATFYATQGLFSGENVDICDSDTQVGWVSPGLGGSNFIAFPPGYIKEPLYNLEAPGGDSGIVGRFGFIGVFFPMFIDVKLDPQRANGLTATVVNAPELFTGKVNGTFTRYWGVPTDKAHDSERYNPLEAIACEGPCFGPTASGLPPTPLMSNPTSCGPKTVGTGGVSYELWPENVFFDSAPLGEITGCNAVPFEPSVSVTPTTRSAGTSSGLEVDLDIPQPGLLNPLGRATAHLKDSTVTLPKGVTVNASLSDGLGSCTEEEIGLDTNEEQIVHAENHGVPVSLSFEGESTPMLPQRATSSEVQSALEALSTVGPGGVAVSGRPGGPWTVDFGGKLAGVDVPPIEGSNSELQRIAVHSKGGTYKLAFEGQETTSLAWNSNAPEVQAALEALPNIAPGDITVLGGQTFGQISFDGGWLFRVAFLGNYTGVNVPSITFDASQLEKRGNSFEKQAFIENTILAEGGSTSSNDPVQDGGTLRFDAADPKCPASSKVASGELVTPALNEPLHVDFFLAKQADNPFDSLFAGYLVAKGGGATIKTAAKIEVDQETGQITTTFKDNPETPFSSLSLHFKSGNRGLVTTPDHCGTYQSSYSLTPWSGEPPVTGTSSFTIDENCQHAFAPTFSAGSESPLAGAFTTFFTRFTRNSGTPPLTGVSTNLPTGVSAKLAGVPYCPDASLAAVSTDLGTSAAQLEAPSCPASSQVGTVNVGTGSGTPFYINSGKVYLAGPYKGAPVSLAVVVPVIAGPFDLGSTLVRVPLRLDPITAQVEAVSDPLPTKLHGLPVDLRDLRVNLDRAAFAINPTSCAVKQATATIEGVGGVTAQVSQRFQIGECAALGLKPKFSLRLRGGTTRTKHPALTVILRPRLGDANIESVEVTFPPSQLLDQSHIGTVCTRVQWAADQCPAGSVYGTVTATTPLLDNPLTGNVYLRSSSNPLPDLVTDLRGPANQPIRLEAAGQTDTAKGDRLRNTFHFIPDAPISRVVLEMKGGKKGLLQNNTNICAKPYRASVKFRAHNGRTYGVAPKVVANCSSKRKQPRRHRH